MLEQIPQFAPALGMVQSTIESFALAATRSRTCKARGLEVLRSLCVCRVLARNSLHAWSCRCKRHGTCRHVHCCSHHNGGKQEVSETHLEQHALGVVQLPELVDQQGQEALVDGKATGWLVGVHLEGDIGVGFKVRAVVGRPQRQRQGLRPGAPRKERIDISSLQLALVTVCCSSL